MATLPTNPVVLVDGSSYLYRAFFAFPPLTNEAGEPTGAIYGVLTMLKSLIDKVQPSAFAVVFDAKGKTFRDELFEHYKSHRPPMPDDLRSQIAPLHKMIQDLGMPLLVVEGVEADDVIGTLAKQASLAGRNVVISTGDKDMAQLVDERVMLINTMQDSLLDSAGVVEKYGVPPHLIIDYLALCGDKSDNIPGVKGIGPAKAKPLLNYIGNIETIYQHLDDVEPVFAEHGVRGAKSTVKNLNEEKENALLSQQLATIKTDVALDVDLADLHFTAPNFTAFAADCERYDFHRWLSAAQKQINPIVSTETADDTPVAEQNEQKMDENSDLAQDLSISKTYSPKPENYRCLLNVQELQAFCDKLRGMECFALKTFTTGTDYINARLVGLAMASPVGEVVYVPLRHDVLSVSEQMPFNEAIAILKPLLESEKPTKIGLDLKYDAHILAHEQISLQGMAFDTMLEAYAFDSTGKHSLEALSQRYLSFTPTDYKDIAGKGKKQLTFDQITLEQATAFAGEQVDIILQLALLLTPAVRAIVPLWALYDELELPLMPVLLQMERNGVLIDSDFLANETAQMAAELASLEQQAYAIAGEPFSLTSPKVLQEVLFEKLKLPVLKKTPSGKPSTNEEVLEELALTHELPSIIMRHRTLSKLKSTYTDKLPQIVDHAGRVHTTYNQAATTTGRLSSSEPNLQNIPVRTEEGRRIRRSFIAREGYKIMAADYSQIELRLMAHLSQDQRLLDAFKRGEDIHKATAAEIFGLPLDSVGSNERRNAKAINFGLIYGMSAFGLAKQLNISVGDAQNYINRYFDRYPSVRRFMQNTPADARHLGYVQTLFGRRLHLPDIDASHQVRRKAAERLAINAPMQGTAADIIKRAMLAIAKAIAGDDSIAMIMQVHDELVFEVKAECVDKWQGEIKRLMESAVSLDVPLIVDVGVGDNWEQAH